MREHPAPSWRAHGTGAGRASAHLRATGAGSSCGLGLDSSARLAAGLERQASSSCATCASVRCRARASSCAAPRPALSRSSQQDTLAEGTVSWLLGRLCHDTPGCITQVCSCSRQPISWPNVCLLDPMNAYTCILRAALTHLLGGLAHKPGHKCAVFDERLPEREVQAAPQSNPLLAHCVAAKCN